MNCKKEINTASETSAAREYVIKYCKGIGIDIGYGGDKVTENAWAFDMPKPYTNVGGDAQQLRGNAKCLAFIGDNSLDFIYSSHLLEDFSYSDITAILKEWRRVLKPGGYIITNCPNQQKFLAHCSETGQPLNLAHFEQDFSLENFLNNCIKESGKWEQVYEKPELGPYSWLLVVKKIESSEDTLSRLNHDQETALMQFLYSDYDQINEIIDNKNKLNQIQHDISYLKDEIKWMKNSLSWNVTAPIRNLLTYIKSF